MNQDKNTAPQQQHAGLRAMAHAARDASDAVQILGAQLDKLDPDMFRGDACPA